MQIQGEVFFLINGWMNFLSLALAAHLARRPLPVLRGMLAALLFALYALWAAAGAPIWQSIPALLAGAYGMASVAFGHFPWQMGLTVFAGGLMLGGATDIFLARGVDWKWALALCGVVTCIVCRLLRLHLPHGQKSFVLEILWRGKHLLIPAARDSGNGLKDPVSGLPVVVVPCAMAKKLLPPGAIPSDLSTLPRGWYPVRVQTAAGKRMIMCMRPDALLLRRGKAKYVIAAAVAVADFPGQRALLPDMLFWQEEDIPNASL